MAITDRTTWVMGDTINLHECDNCLTLLDGIPYCYWEKKDFTLCSNCIFSFSNNWNKPNTPTIQVYQKAKIPNDLKWKVWERDNFTCQYCKSRKKLSLDHVNPESLGGKTTISNLVTACFSCNSSKGARTPERAGMQLLFDPRATGDD